MKIIKLIILAISFFDALVFGPTEKYDGVIFFVLLALS